MAMVRLVSGGMVSRTAWGSTTWRIVCTKLKPVERAASHCPRGTARMPAQKISSANAARTPERASQVATKPVRRTPTVGRAKYRIMMSTSGGSARSTSTATMMKKLTTRRRSVRRSAAARPVARPVATITAASCSVTTKPSAIFGAYCAMTSQLRKVSPNLPIQRGDELADADVLRPVEDLLRRALLEDAALVHEHDAVGGASCKPHLVRNHHHGHAPLPHLAHHGEHAAHELGVE